MKVKHFLAIGLLCCCTGVAAVSCSSKAKNTASTEQQDGIQYIDFGMEDPDGKPIKVSDFVGKNKYTLIDFWASWCGPCHAEMPTVSRAYDEFRSKGLEIIGVSLDNNKSDWMKGISDLKMTWPQMSDLKGWECAGAQLYGVRAIPANVLVDQKGRIVAQNLRGENLIQKLSELLK